MSQRVVITGLGVLSSLGIGHEAFWEGLLAGRSGIFEIPYFDLSEFEIHRGGIVRGFEPERVLGPELAQELGRATQFALAATQMAFRDAGLDPARLNAERVGVSLGTSVAESMAIERITELSLREGWDAVPADLLRQTPGYSIPGRVAAQHGFSGVNRLLPTACSAGNYAIGDAFDQIRLGRTDVMVAGAADPFSQIAFVGFHKLKSMASDVSRPFSKDRTGMMVAEGAGIMILESYERARARKAIIYAEILGYGLSCDAHHMTSPHPEGTGAFSAMEQAVRHAGVSAREIDYISAHGTGTPLNDRVETLAIKHLLGERAREVPISSVKSMLGHAMGAASALEAIVCALAIHTGSIPPTANYQEPDPQCDLDYVPNEARHVPLRVAMSNSFAFGGNNASLVFGALERGEP